jgi:hypothetical protein
MARDRAALEHSRDNPPWSWCGDRRVADFGSVFAWPAARGAVALTFDRNGRHHAMTLFAPAPLEAEIAIFGRRFDVVWTAEAKADR